MAVTNFRKVVSHENLTVTFFNPSKYPLSDIKKKKVITATSPAKKKCLKSSIKILQKFSENKMKT